MFAPPIRVDDNEFISVRLDEIRNEMQCPICLGIIRRTRTVMECLHRFCRECIDKAMRLGKNECPACRAHCASRRSLRDDPRFDSLISLLYPDLEAYEEEELKLRAEEWQFNRKVQSLILRTQRRQSVALARARSQPWMGVEEEGEGEEGVREGPGIHGARLLARQVEEEEEQGLEVEVEDIVEEEEVEEEEVQEMEAEEVVEAVEEEVGRVRGRGGVVDSLNVGMERKEDKKDWRVAEEARGLEECDELAAARLSHRPHSLQSAVVSAATSPAVAVSAAVAAATTHGAWGGGVGGRGKKRRLVLEAHRRRGSREEGEGRSGVGNLEGWEKGVHVERMEVGEEASGILARGGKELPEEEEEEEIHEEWERREGASPVDGMGWESDQHLAGNVEGGSRKGRLQLHATAQRIQKEMGAVGSRERGQGSGEVAGAGRASGSANGRGGGAGEATGGAGAVVPRAPRRRHAEEDGSALDEQRGNGGGEKAPSRSLPRPPPSASCGTMQYKNTVAPEARPHPPSASNSPPSSSPPGLSEAAERLRRRLMWRGSSLFGREEAAGAPGGSGEGDGQGMPGVGGCAAGHSQEREAFIQVLLLPSLSSSSTAATTSSSSSSGSSLPRIRVAVPQRLAVPAFFSWLVRRKLWLPPSRVVSFCAAGKAAAAATAGGGRHVGTARPSREGVLRKGVGQGRQGSGSMPAAAAAPAPGSCHPRSGFARERDMGGGESEREGKDGSGSRGLEGGGRQKHARRGAAGDEGMVLRYTIEA